MEPKAVEQGAKLIIDTIARNVESNVIVATGVSQFEMLNELANQGIDWSMVVCHSRRCAENGD